MEGDNTLEKGGEGEGKRREGERGRERERAKRVNNSYTKLFFTINIHPNLK